MVDFNKDTTPTGSPQLDANYWSKLVTNKTFDNPTITTIFDKNINAFLDDISIFKGSK